MLEANYADIHSIWGASTPWANHYESDNKFQEHVSYDLRGNIQSLFRKGTSADPFTFPESTLMAGTFAQIDELYYEYNNPNDPASNLNKLASVTDISNNLTRGFKTANANNNNINIPDYTYDANGNITSDLNKGITNITYNYLNLPQKISFANYDAIYFVYDATGQKHQKIVQNETGVIDPTTYTYSNGIEYKNGVLQRFAHTEGSVSLQADGSTYKHEYVIKDHLGNTRVTYRDDDILGVSPLGTIKVEEIVQTNHYYPFGLNMEGNWNGSFPEVKNKYQYNGKELNTDFGLDWNDYGARFYDPAISRWNTVDPLAEKMRRHSPYNYAFDNPMRFVDPDGQQGEDWVKGKDGKIYNDFSVTSKFEAWQKGVEYIGNNKLLVDKNTNAGYYLPFCSATAQCWGQIGETTTVTESRNPRHLREDNPDYLPTNSVAMGVQGTVTINGLFTSQSFSGGAALGLGGQVGVFVSSTSGAGVQMPGISVSLSVFSASTNGAVDLKKLGGGSVGASGALDIFGIGYSESTVDGTRKRDPNGYKVSSFSIGEPGVGFNINYSKTKILTTKKD